jgi:hypothetical protein
MMAPNRSQDSDGGRFPSAETLELVRVALTQYLAGKMRDEQEVCDALAVLAKEAHERQLQAEEMLIAFKRIWYAMPYVTPIANRAEQQRVLDRLIRLCIDVFYQR